MGYFQQFKKIDPMTGSVPRWPFPLAEIARRARVLVKGRTTEQLVSAAMSVDWFIEQYFDSEKEIFIHRLATRGGWELQYLPEDSRDEIGIRYLLDNWPADVDDERPFIPSSDNTTELDALKSCIDEYFLEDDEEFPNGQQHEYFATLALWLVIDAVTWMRRIGKTDSENKLLELLVGSEATSFLREPLSVETGHALAGGCAIQAMEAVCWAEHLKATQGYQREIDSLRLGLIKANKTAATATEAFNSIKAATHDLAEQKAKEKISLAASKAAIARHTENHAMKAQVFEWCNDNLGAYQSLDSATDAIVKLVPVAWRTVRKWLTDYRKSKEYSLRA